MKKLFYMLLLVVGIISTTKAASPDLTITLWDNTSAPHSSGLSGEVTEDKPNRLGNVTKAEMLIYEAKGENKKDQAVIILPGGGYRILSMDNEGTLVAEWFAENGITAAVLKYRQPNGNCEVPYEDVVEALKVMRMRSRQFGYAHDKVGLVGFSAGGHLAASVATLAPVEQRPNFSVLFYTIISEVASLDHMGDLNGLLGEDRRGDRKHQFMALDQFVDDNTPPSIMFGTNDDKIVPADNTALYYSELRRRNIYASIYIFPQGGHGWSMSPRVKTELWQPLLLDWMEKLKYNNE